jgi:hypothetical protein
MRKTGLAFQITFLWYSQGTAIPAKASKSGEISCIVMVVSSSKGNHHMTKAVRSQDEDS